MKLPKTLKWAALDEAAKEAALIRPAVQAGEGVARGVSEIIASVRAGGDTSLRELTERFDKVRLVDFEVTAEEKEVAVRSVSAQAKQAIGRAAKEIRAFHKAQRQAPLMTEHTPGVRCSRRAVPIGRVGLYLPGGSAPLPSTALMLGIPANIAGCELKLACSPPRRDGSLDPHLIYAAEIAGIDRFFKLGGAQAIAAMAYGTSSVPKVDKIFGPGNAWVTEAKLQVAASPSGAPFDMPAGPSEVMVVCDTSANAAFVASDLLSQAEHGPDSQVVLVSTSSSMITKVKAELERQVADLPRKAIAEASLQRSVFVKVKNLTSALEVANRYAAEHLILQVKEPRYWANEVRNAGSVFLGPWSPESVGDYASGTNHVLPTYGYARSFSGVGLDSFLKQITFQELSPRGLRTLGPTVETLAELEGLSAHRRAVSIRLAELGGAK